MIENKINDYINAHPRKTLQFSAIVLFLVWQTVPGVAGLVAYVVAKKYFNWKNLLLFGITAAITSIIVKQHFSIDLTKFIEDGFLLNVNFLKYILVDSRIETLGIFHQELIYIFGIPFLLAGVLRLLDLIPENPHQQVIKDLQKGILDGKQKELSQKELTAKLNAIDESKFDATVLGVSLHTGLSVTIPDRDINQVMLILGTTGSGKTVTLRRFYQRAIVKGYPLIIVDGKPDEKNIQWLKGLADKHNRIFFGFNCGNYLSYDPLSNGGYTELKDKIISLKDEWSSDYYRSIAEDYLQTVFEVLLKSGKSFDLKTVVHHLNFENLAMLARETDNPDLMKRVSSIEHYDRKDITGLQAHLNILVHSELGQFFERNETTFSLTNVISQCGVVYFALPALRFPSFSKVLGKLVINDIKAVVDRRSNDDVKIFTAFDEFSVFAGEQVLNLVNMGRGKGVHAIFGTQGLADLDRVDPSFKSQILNCANTLICHRLNDQESAESIANWVGTRDAFTVTAQLNTAQGDGGAGSVRVNKEFIVHPDEIKQGLKVGEAFWVSKVGKFNREKVIVKPPAGQVT